MRCIIALILAVLAVASAAKNTYDEWHRLTPPEADMFLDHNLKKKNLDEEGRREMLAMKTQWADMDKERLSLTLPGNIQVFAIWSLFPIAAAAGVYLFRKHRVSRTFYQLLWVYASIYGLYALNGPSDSMGAGHMHLLIIPVLLAIVSIPVLIVGMIDLRKKDSAAG